MEVNAYLVWGDLVSGFLETGIPKQDLKPKLASIELWFKKKKKKIQVEEMACAKAQILFYFHTALYVLPVSHGFFLKKVEEKRRRQKCAQKVLCPGYTNL